MRQILAHTPAWVFALFLVLLVFGLMQARTRAVRRQPALLLPAGMIALWLAGIVSSFGPQLLPLMAWGIALIASSLAGCVIFRDKRIGFNRAAGKLLIPGSWVPLGVIMAIFFAKYVYAVLAAFDAHIIHAPGFVMALSALYGVLSGYLAARGLNLIRQARQA